MKLGVFRTLGTAFVFSLRHFAAFYLLALLVGLPRYLTHVLGLENPAPRALVLNLGLDINTVGVEIVLIGFVSAVMVRTLMRDRQGDDWTVLRGLGDALERLPTVLTVSALLAAGMTLSLIAVEVVRAIPALKGIPVGGAMLGIVVVISLHFVIAIPCAADDDAGVAESFGRSAALIHDSRLRLVAIVILAMIPAVVGGAALAAIYVANWEAAPLPALWVLLAGSLANMFFLALPVVIHETLTGADGNAAFGETAEAFD